MDVRVVPAQLPGGEPHPQGHRDGFLTQSLSITSSGLLYQLLNHKDLKRLIQHLKVAKCDIEQ